MTTSGPEACEATEGTEPRCLDSTAKAGWGKRAGPYGMGEVLDAAIYDDILHEATWIAEARCCFVEADFTAADAGRRL